MTDTTAQLTPNILSILKWPDNKLHEKSVDVTVFDESLRQLAVDLLATMKASNGIGLAAPQTGNMVNVIAISLFEGAHYIFVNPIITETSEELFEVNEGCLSVPGYFEMRSRPKKISMKFQDVEGNTHEVECYDMYAFAIQHEIDHLSGKVFVDGSSALKTSRIKSKIKKTLKNK